MKFTLALAQIDNVLGDLKKNTQKHIEYTRRARDGGADLVVFPELSLTGYSIKDSSLDLALQISNLQAPRHRAARPGRPALRDSLRSRENVLRGIIRESADISIIMGCIEQSADFGIYNSALFIEKRAVATVHRKVYPPTYGMFEEMRYFSPGNRAGAFDTALGRIGVLICEDLWHLPLPYLLAKDGAQVIIGIAASPTRLSGEAEGLQNARINSEQHRAFARLLSTYVVFCNRVGLEDGVNFWGGSEVVGPGGEILVQAKYFEEDLVFVTIDDNELRRARQFSRHFLDDDPGLVLSELARIVKPPFFSY
ncbi:MAG TPA: nitrilase-related carbon-nitrogen hydrolase [Bacteroidota bacterium]|nr:nitrilase-related carbon-nitrogen hydrolase [Bacteroidota bacterium]